MNPRKWLRADVVILALFILTASWGASVWFKKHQQQTKQEEAIKAETTADTERAKSALAELRAAWNADDSWEHQVYPPSNEAPIYTLEVEHALVNGRNIIVIGEIQDVRTATDQSGPVVLIQSHSSPNSVDLRFSLVTTHDVANSILSESRTHPPDEFETFISVAAIQHVEKIEQPADKEGNEQDYFLAHGTLFATRPTHLFEPDPKDLGEN
jgi:hypothetical protein